MSTYKPWYVFIVVTLALFGTLPHALHFFTFGLQTIANDGRWMRNFPNEFTHQHCLLDLPFWHDRFVIANGPHGEVQIDGIDPETGSRSGLNIALPHPVNLLAFGDRLFAREFRNNESAEIVDGQLQSAQIPEFSINSLYNERRFLLNGQPAVLQCSPAGLTVETLTSGSWKLAYDVILPDLRRRGTIGNSKAIFGLDPYRKPDCLNQGDRLHLMIRYGSHVFYREGIHLGPQGETSGNLFGPIVPGQIVPGQNRDQTASALTPENFDPELEGWSLVREDSEIPAASVTWSLPVEGIMLIDGQPAALIVDEIEPGNTVGSIYKYDGKKWSAFAKQPFEFGSNAFRVVATADGKMSYIVAATSMGAARVYAVDSDGVRLTQGADEFPAIGILKAKSFILELILIPVIGFLFACVQGLGTSRAMRKRTDSEYEFDLRVVALASVRRRGLARTIDLGLIGLATAGLGAFLTIGFDVNAFLEALHLGFDHSTVKAAPKILLDLVLCFGFAWFALLVMQGITGFTPGKRICGIRTVASTLERCGIGRSLIRECALIVDSGCLLFWPPGILWIALSKYRQRFGDLIADTIVIENA